MNGYKIAGPNVLARIPHDELDTLFRAHGYEPYFFEGVEPAAMHGLMAAALDMAVTRIQATWRAARERGFTTRPRCP